MHADQKRIYTKYADYVKICRFFKVTFFCFKNCLGPHPEPERPQGAICQAEHHGHHRVFWQQEARKPYFILVDFSTFAYQNSINLVQ